MCLIFKIKKINKLIVFSRKPSRIVTSEQLLTPSSSAVGELINSETHELESLASNTLIKTISALDCVGGGGHMMASSLTSSTVPLEYEHAFQRSAEQQKLQDIECNIVVDLPFMNMTHTMDANGINLQQLK